MVKPRATRASTAKKRSAESAAADDEPLKKQAKKDVELPKASQDSQNQDLSAPSKDTATIFVGPRNIPFQFSKSLLCSKSHFFKHYFLATNDDTAYFADQEPQSFDVLRLYLTTGSLPLLKTVKKGLDHLWLWNPLYTYCLAYKLLLAPLCDKVMDAWLAHDFSQNGFPALEYVKEIVERVPRGSAPWIYAARSVGYFLGVMRHEDDLTRWTTEGV